MSTATNPSDQKAERFRRVAQRRVNNVLDAIRLLSQCSNRRTYEYTEDDVSRMFREVDREIRAAKQSFISQDKKKGFSF